ncbi:hypothetical protein ACFSUS_25655 [Spirosoma soli]|uniref:Uncharacterized protein n=1 Tax=Spirosoma soli TaxID=1770529 RepID=A0ABW5MCR1_9BACT
MKLIACLLLLGVYAYVQVPATAIRHGHTSMRSDSMPSVFPPDLMPNIGANNSFYRYKSDLPNVVRATLDNMPVKVPDSSIQYSALPVLPTYPKPNQPAVPFIKPLPPVLPKHWKKD